MLDGLDDVYADTFDTPLLLSYSSQDSAAIRVFAWSGMTVNTTTFITASPRIGKGNVIIKVLYSIPVPTTLSRSSYVIIALALSS